MDGRYVIRAAAVELALGCEIIGGDMMLEAHHERRGKEGRRNPSSSPRALQLLLHPSSRSRAPYLHSGVKSSCDAGARILPL